jgi:hypothetical protein
LLLAGRRHVRGLPGLLAVAEALSCRRMGRVVLLRRVVSVQIVMGVDGVGIAGVVGIRVVLVEHGVGPVCGVVLLFCTHELTLGRQSSTAIGDGGGVNLPS